MVVSRRRFIAISSAATITPLASPYIGNAAQQSIKFVGFGGIYQAGQTKALFEPFERETGISIVQTSEDIDLAVIQEQVAAHRAPSLLSLPDRMVIAAAADNLLEPIDYKIIDAAHIGYNLAQHHYVGAVIISMLLTNRATLNPAPANWAEFWDFAKFTGQRGFYDGPAYSLEFALLADGVEKQSLYPLDVDRAFHSLDKIKPHINNWWSSFSAPDFLFDTGHIDMTPWTRSTTMMFAGKPLKVSYEGAAFTFESWCIPRGTENKEAVMRFINWAIQPEQQAELTKYIRFAPTNTLAMPMIDNKIKPLLATYPENAEKGFFLSGEWWRDNMTAITSRWRRWRNITAR